MIRSATPFRLSALMVLCILLFVAAGPCLAVTLQEEIDLGKKLDVEILKQTPLSTDQEALKEIEQYGERLVKGVRRPEIKYHFRILQDDELNAFSTPGGYIYFTDHIWNVLRKDERIGVLAHEIVHSDRRHALDAMLKAQRRQIWLAVILTAVGANDTWGNIADLAHSLYTLKYSRGDERQADEVGVELCQKAGYNPAGLLLAMRKINRFQADSGGVPPKIFSSHPPTPERLKYLAEILTKMGIPIPPEDVRQVASPHRIGEVTAVDKDSVRFSSSQPLDRDSVVWLMGSGWDYYYENNTEVPIARAVVTREGAPYDAMVWLMPQGKAAEIKQGTGVYAPPAPKPETGVGTITPVSHTPGDTGKLKMKGTVKMLDRFLARQVVWTKDRTKLQYDNVGYVVLTGGPSEGKFISLPRPDYGYAPISENSILAKLVDPNKDRWIGTVVSIGRSGGTLEVLPTMSSDQLDKARTAGRRFDVAYPAWSSKDTYENRVIGQATVKSLDKKIVFQMLSYTPGYGPASLQNGFDIYEEVKQKDPATEKK